jgi:hypothetical protein
MGKDDKQGEKDEEKHGRGEEARAAGVRVGLG